MSPGPEIWLGQSDRHPLAMRRRTTLVAPVPNPVVKFYRGDSWYQPSEAHGNVEVPAIAAVDKKVLGWLAKHGDLPESAVVLTVRVQDPKVTQGTLEIETPKGARTFTMTRAATGWECPQRFVLMYGEDGDLQGAAFKGIELIDVAKSGDIPFEQLIKFRVQGFERELGVVDFLIKDVDGKFRTARHGIFKGRRPSFQLIAPRIGPNFMEVFLDDADDETPDEIEITRLVKPAGAVTSKSDFAEAVKKDSADVVVEMGEDQPRRRVFDQSPEQGEVATFMLGENRVRIEDSRNGLVYFQGNFLLYEKPEETIPLGNAVEEEEYERDGVRLRVGKGVLTLLLDSGLKDAAMAAYLYAVRLRPRGMLREAGYLQAGTFTRMPAAELERLIARLKGFNDPGVIAVDFDVRIQPEAAESTMTLERVPLAFRNTNSIDEVAYDAADGTFKNAQPHFHHHFAIHTFAAHRLIDRLTFQEADTPAFTLIGANFDHDKTFLLPTAKDEAARIVEARREHADAKLAVFAHTDATGSDTYNNELSKRRARTTFALLTHDVDEWMKRLDGSFIANEQQWGTREVQHMLTVTGHFAGPVTGIKDAATKKAIGDFQSANGLTATGIDDKATRRKLVDAYMKEMTGEGLAAGDFFEDVAGKPALFACGEAFPVIPTDNADPTNRRVVVVLRRTPVEPVDTSLVGPAVPFPDWLLPEPPDEKASKPPFVIGCGDTGFGLRDDFRGDRLKMPNRWFTTGERIVRPTDVNSAAAVNTIVFDDGDMTGISDADPGRIFHGSAVMTCMTGDGVGSSPDGSHIRTSREVVLGTGKDMRFRPIRTAVDFASGLRRFEVIAADPEIKIISSSFLQQNFAGLAAATQQQLRDRIKKMIDGGRIFFIAAANTNPSFPAQRDVARTEGGSLAPTRTQTRASFSGDQEFRGRIAVVGATNHVVREGEPELPASFTYLGEEVSLACPGTAIRAVSPLVPPAGGAQKAEEDLVEGVRLILIQGTSFSTPMTAGIAGELLLVNPELQKPENIGKTIEFMEATADPIPSLAAAPTATPTATPGVTINEQGISLPGQPNPDPQLTNADLSGFRRVHFWKAVLAAANDGIPAESKLADGSGATNLFTQLTALDHAATTWYGFEIRTRVLGATVWLRRADGTHVQIEDTGATLPRGQSHASAWRRTQNFTVASTHPNALLRGFTIPPLPINSQKLFMCQFSIRREELAEFSELRLFMPGVDPSTPTAGDIPPLLSLSLTKIERMRDPRAITAEERAADLELDQIATLVDRFDDFVFHITTRSQALAGFRFVHDAALAVGGKMNITLFAIDKFGNIKADFHEEHARVFHTGTKPVDGEVRSGVFLHGRPEQKPAPFQLNDGRSRFVLEAFTAESFHLTATHPSGASERNPIDIKVAVPGPLSAFRVDIRREDGSEPGLHPPAVEDPLEVTVTPLDAEGRPKLDYRGTAELKVIEGKPGSDAPAGESPAKIGVQAAQNFKDPFDPQKLKHTFTEEDKGHFKFKVFNYTAGPLQLEARDGDSSGSSARIETRGGKLHGFFLEVPTELTIGQPAQLTVTCIDEFENVVVDADTKVRVTVATGPSGKIEAGVKKGMFVQESSSKTDDFKMMEPGDEGVARFSVTAWTATKYKLEVLSGGGAKARSEELTAGNPGPMVSLGLEVFESQMTGVRFRVRVKALGQDHNVLPTFRGVVNVSLVDGTPFNAAGPEGVQLHKLVHQYRAEDNGEFQFEVTAFTAETIRLQFDSQSVVATTSNITVQ